jgi:alkyl sulfatase BDS1-like metallo-beta-lactamase superfamily hydrolase
VLEAVVLEPQGLAEALGREGNRVTGDAAKLSALFAMLDDFRLMFEIVTPGSRDV